MSALSALTKDLGIGETAATAIAWLWAGGWWHWVPAVLVAFVGIYSLLLERRLPWHAALYKDLAQLSKGEGSHPALHKVIQRTLEGISFGENQRNHLRNIHIDAPNGVGRWLKSMVYANLYLDKWMGSTIWSHSSFNRLLWIAVLYPVVLLHIVWWITGVGQLGSTVLLPSLGEGLDGLIARSFVLGLVLWPAVWIASIRQWTDPSIVKGEDWIYWIVVFVVSFWPWVLAPSAVRLLGLTDIAIAFAGAFVGLIVGAGSGAAAVAIAVAAAGVIAGTVEFNGAGAVVFAAAGAIATIFTAIELKILEWAQSRRSTAVEWPTIAVVSMLVSVSIFVVLLATTTSNWATKKTVSPSNASTMWLFAIGWMPIINALFDWFSLGITRELLRRMTHSFIWMWFGIALDIVAGVLLTMGLFYLQFQILGLMETYGWPLNAKEIRTAFVANPLDPQIAWLAMLAVTNLLPTIWHLGVSLWGLVDRQFTTSVSLKDSLMKLNDFMDDKGNPRTGATAPGLGELELQTVYHSLFVHPWLYVGTVVAVVAGFWGSYVQALRWTLTWLP